MRAILSPADSPWQFDEAGARSRLALESGPFCGESRRHTDGERCSRRCCSRCRPRAAARGGAAADARGADAGDGRRAGRRGAIPRAEAARAALRAARVARHALLRAAGSAQPRDERAEPDAARDRRRPLLLPRRRRQRGDGPLGQPDRARVRLATSSCCSTAISTRCAGATSPTSTPTRSGWRLALRPRGAPLLRLHRARDARGARARARAHGARRSRRRPHHHLVRSGAHRPRVQRRGAGADLLGALRAESDERSRDPLAVPRPRSRRSARGLFTHVELSTDISRFMPAESDAELASLASRLADSELTRTMILTVGAADLDAAVAAARALGDRLRGDPELASVRTGVDPEQLEEIYRLYFPRRHAFLSEDPEREIPALAAPDALRQRAREVRASLALPTATLTKRLATSDPIGAFERLVGRLGQPAPAARPARRRLRHARPPLRGAVPHHAPLGVRLRAAGAPARADRRRVRGDRGGEPGAARAREERREPLRGRRRGGDPARRELDHRGVVARRRGGVPGLPALAALLPARGAARGVGDRRREPSSRGSSSAGSTA